MPLNKETKQNQHSLIVFHGSPRGNKSPLVSRTLLSFLTDLKNGIVLMPLIRTLISNPSSSLIKPFGAVPSRSLTIGITDTLMFLNFLR